MSALTRLVVVLVCFLSTISLQAAGMKVATLHPLISDLASQVGGDRVEVVSLVPKNANLHSFEPNPSQLRLAAGSRVVLASGKGIEPYLKDLADSLGAKVGILEVGRPIPSIKTDPAQQLFVCCPNHAKGGIDPHWWHSPENMKRAASIIADEFARLDPANAAVYKANAREAERKLSILNGWAKQQLSRIPRDRRYLVTAHAAFGYFCKEYGFKTIPVQGVSSDDDGSPTYLTQTIAKIRELKIPAVFSEDTANPKVLGEITRSTGAKLAGSLSADGTNAKFSNYDEMFRHNVTTIVNALAPQAAN